MGLLESIEGGIHMTYQPQKPPTVNGIDETLTEEQILSIKEDLHVIQSSFVPSEEQPELNLFYTVSTYNLQNTEKPINGDTAQYILVYQSGTEGA
jgi:hypothetical protein